MSADQSPFQWLQQFFQSNCDGDWEHDNGCTIETASDPGWKFTFNLRGTSYEHLNLEELEDHQAPINWLRCKVENSTFIAFCSPRRLEDCISILRDLVEGRR